jgi:uncharacterized membrane protein (DUF485 family)
MTALVTFVTDFMNIEIYTFGTTVVTLGYVIGSGLLVGLVFSVIGRLRKR